jgi:hypothetical protein
MGRLKKLSNGKIILTIFLKGPEELDGRQVVQRARTGQDQQDQAGADLLDSPFPVEKFFSADL